MAILLAMSKGVQWAATLALGVAGGFLGSMLARTSGPTAAPAESASATPAVERSDLDRLERRVRELSAAVNLRPVDPAASGSPAPAGLAAAPRNPAGGSAPATPEPSASPDRLDALEKRVVALESRGAGGAPLPADLSSLPSTQLEALSRTLTAEKRSADAIKVSEELLRRSDLTPDQRVDVEMNIGYALRTQGKNAEAEARFRETLSRVGDDSEKTPWLGFQIGWERNYQKDLPGAIAEMERAANHALVQPLLRAHALYNAASFSRQNGETARAQAFLERLLAQHADAFPPAQAAMKAQAEAWLKEIRGR
jgi:hypothetical protein